MHTLSDARIQRLAESCVNSMGDIFWDYDEPRDVPLGHRRPWEVATEAVAATLQSFAKTCESNPIYTTALRQEYQEIVRSVGENADHSAIVASLVTDAEWTKQGARTVLELSRQYGTSILRNALALAEALSIEDGEAGM